MTLNFLRTASKQFYIVNTIHIYPITYGSYVFPAYPSGVFFAKKGILGHFGPKTGVFRAVMALNFLGTK